MRNKILPYYLALGVLAVFTLGLTGYVVSQASPTKYDRQLEKKANEIAEKLNEYTLENDAPKSLAEAKIASTEGIAYKPTKDGYQFCITYKANTGGVDAEKLVTSYYGFSDYEDEQSELYIDSNHKKGENCQTVKPYSYGSIDEDYETDAEGTDEQAAEDAARADAECFKIPTSQMQAYMDCLEQNDSPQSVPTTTNPTTRLN